MYPQHFDRKKELRKLNHSLLVNFLDLLDLLVRFPDSPRRAEKVEDLSLLFIHIHHLLNEFRPHQARETLRVMLELQKRQRIETAQRFEKHFDKVRNLYLNKFNLLKKKQYILMNSIRLFLYLYSKLTIFIRIFSIFKMYNILNHYCIYLVLFG